MNSVFSNPLDGLKLKKETSAMSPFDKRNSMTKQKSLQQQLHDDPDMEFFIQANNLDFDKDQGEDVLRNFDEIIFDS